LNGKDRTVKDTPLAKNFFKFYQRKALQFPPAQLSVTHLGAFKSCNPEENPARTLKTISFSEIKGDG